MEGSSGFFWLDFQLANRGTVLEKNFRQVQLHDSPIP